MTQAPISERLIQALRPLLFRSRTRLTPPQLQELAERIAADYQAALQDEGHASDPAQLGQEMASRGLHPEMLFAVADVLYEIGYSQSPAQGRRTGAYLQALLSAFTAQRERLLKQELEASIQALHRLQSAK